MLVATEEPLFPDWCPLCMAPLGASKHRLPVSGLLPNEATHTVRVPICDGCGAKRRRYWRFAWRLSFAVVLVCVATKLIVDGGLAPQRIVETAPETTEIHDKWYALGTWALVLIWVIAHWGWPKLALGRHIPKVDMERVFIQPHGVLYRPRVSSAYWEYQFRYDQLNRGHRGPGSQPPTTVTDVQDPHI